MKTDYYNYYKTIIKEKGLSKNTLYTDGNAIFYTTGKSIHLISPGKSKELAIYTLKDYILSKDNTAKFKTVHKIFLSKYLLENYINENTTFIKEKGVK